MNQEEASEFKQQRNAEVEKNRMQKREEIFSKDRADPPPMQENKNIATESEEKKYDLFVVDERFRAQVEEYFYLYAAP